MQMKNKVNAMRYAIKEFTSEFIQYVILNNPLHKKVGKFNVHICTMKSLRL